MSSPRLRLDQRGAQTSGDGEPDSPELGRKLGFGQYAGREGLAEHSPAYVVHGHGRDERWLAPDVLHAEGRAGRGLDLRGLLGPVDRVVLDDDRAARGDVARGEVEQRRPPPLVW